MSIAQGFKIWRAGTAFLVERGDTILLVDATGAIAKRYASSQWEADGELGRLWYVVEDGALREHELIHRSGAIDKYESIVIENVVPDDAPESVRFITTALGDDAVVQEERRLRDAPE